ncbi:hypothetical protein SDC9_183840 [bioreactor metagenome]|uniref:Uncharacterized protein n=1 Tax=bioreactor metagenome TaxID=1076179 RepID=A0A645HBB3_9ZZZZ
MRQWSYEFDKLSLINVPNYVGRNYYGRQDDEHLVIMDTIPSEKMRSAYLNALSWLSQMTSSESELDLLEFFSLKALPVDFGLWELRSHTPLSIYFADELNECDTLDSLQSSIVQVLQDMQTRTKDDSEILCFSSGRLHTKSGIYELEHVHTIESTIIANKIKPAKTMSSLS